MSGPDLRILQANERTLLAWMRTALGLMAFGFVVARLGVLLPEVGEEPVVGGGTLAVGEGLLVLGSATLVMAIFRFLDAHRAIVAGQDHVPAPGPVIALAATIAASGLGLAGYLALR